MSSVSKPGAPGAGAQPLTLFEKLWRRHVVVEPTDAHPPVVYVDLHLVHEVTSPQAFSELRRRGLSVRRADRTIATMDHSTPTLVDESGKARFFNRETEAQVETLRRNCEEFGVELYPLGDARQGIVHVIGPELGLTRPGMTIVCGDSHTSTHGAFGAWAFGIGTTEVGHVLATQCLLQDKPKTFEVRVDGKLPPGVTAKDLILAIIHEIGVDGGIGHVIEYTGSAVRSLSMEERMTVCNMSIEGGARAGLIAPDETTFSYLEGRAFSPRGEAWEEAVRDWKRLPTDPGAVYDRSITLDATRLEPMITYGTNPGMSVPVSRPVPSGKSSAAIDKALDYMGVKPGESLIGKPIDVVFIGSCTNSRMSDLRLAASVFRGRHVAKGVRTLVVPGSQEIKRQAIAEGLDRIFLEAGAEWREPGCSMCIAMNGDQLSPGELAVSTSNRNFEGRQGKGGRTILASPLTAAASAVTGAITDARELLD
jgi:3-isopropylmalate/(R)-2-methylmalate dehydratase large subunit